MKMKKANKTMEALENFASYILAHWREAPSHTRAGILYREAQAENKAMRETITGLLERAEQLNTLEDMAATQGAVIYNICFRNAGVGIQWYEEKRQGEHNDFKQGLVIYSYHPTFREAVSAEIKRLQESK